MISRRFPTLTVARIAGISDWAGMVPLNGFDLRIVCDDDLVPGTRASVLLREAVGDMLEQAKDIAKAALSFDGIVRDGPFLSALPRLSGAPPELVVAWRASAGISFVASSVQLPHLHQDGNEYAGYDGRGRIVALTPNFASHSPAKPGG
jgi:hypothetical protein